jgi:hypothetical protein
MSPRLRPGEVRDAIRAYLGEIGQDASTKEIYKAVNERIGSGVSSSSVRSSLQLSDLFEQVSRGRYRLARR